MKTSLTCPQGNFQLDIYPLIRNSPLRAWDAADEYILRHLHEQPDRPCVGRTLVVNESYGALLTALQGWHPMFMSDSFIATLGARQNLAQNHLDENQVRWLNSLQTPATSIDLLIVKIPKILSLLEDQLIRLRPCLSEQTIIIGGGMVKAIHSSTLEVFSRIIGPVTTSLARKKARLIHCRLDPTLDPPKSSWPKTWTLEGTNLEILNHANVFSGEKLDIGSRFLLKHIPNDTDARKILDLGCGNGVLGLVAADKNPLAELTFIDESFMAMASAEENFRTGFGTERKAQFLVKDCLDGVAANQFDLILNNPPFHRENVTGDSVAWQMFKQSREALKPGGSLLVVGNRHLGYHTKLAKLFGDTQLIASNPKFVVLGAKKSI